GAGVRELWRNRVVQELVAGDFEVWNRPPNPQQEGQRHFGRPQILSGGGHGLLRFPGRGLDSCQGGLGKGAQVIATLGELEKIDRGVSSFAGQPQGAVSKLRLQKLLLDQRRQRSLRIRARASRRVQRLPRNILAKPALSAQPVHQRVGVAQGDRPQRWSVEPAAGAPPSAGNRLAEGAGSGRIVDGACDSQLALGALYRRIGEQKVESLLAKPLQRLLQRERGRQRLGGWDGVVGPRAAGKGYDTHQRQ